MMAGNVFLVQSTIKVAAQQLLWSDTMAISYNHPMNASQTAMQFANTSTVMTIKSLSMLTSQLLSTLLKIHASVLIALKTERAGDIVIHQAMTSGKHSLLITSKKSSPLFQVVISWTDGTLLHGWIVVHRSLMMKPLSSSPCTKRSAITSGCKMMTQSNVSKICLRTMEIIGMPSQTQ